MRLLFSQHVRKLANKGIKLVSITQEMGARFASWDRNRSYCEPLSPLRG
jgi:hypothetical protein